VQSSTFRNNLVWGNARNAVRAYAIDAAEGPKGLVLVNNTLVADQTGWAFKVSEDLGEHVLFDNVLLGADGAISMDASPNFQSDYNAVTGQLSADGEASVVGLAAFQALGFDAHSFVGSPALFLSAATGDYRLAPGSAAIDKGTASFAGASAPAVDAWGTPRPQGAGFDVGAHEWKP
jgi:hypothetical protein